MVSIPSKPQTPLVNTPEEKSPLERVARRLYARNATVRIHPRRPLHTHEIKTRSDWDDAHLTPQLAQEDTAGLRKDFFAEEKERLKEMAKLSRKETFRLSEGFLAAAFVFFLGALGVGAWFFFSDSSLVSSRNIDINISGPIALAGGDELPLQIEVVNKNRIPLILTDLVVLYPEGTRSAGNLSAPLREQRIPLGTVDSGARVEEVARAALFGKEQSEAQIKVTLEYRIESSNAVFAKEAFYAVKLTSAPLRVEIDALKEISSGQELPLRVTVTSNAAARMNRVMLQAEYPFGFSPTSFEPAPSSGTTRWLLGDLEPGESRTIVIKGLVSGSRSDQRIFKFKAGSANEAGELIAAFSGADAPVLIKKPFVALSLNLGREAQNGFFVARRAETVTAGLLWQNTLPHELYDLELYATVGGYIDKKSVKSQDGFYNSGGGFVTWTEQTVRDFKMVEQGEGGQVSFSFMSLPWNPTSAPLNPTMVLTLRVKAKRITENSVPETLEYTEEQIIRLASNPSLEARALYSTGPFENSGPFPPRAEERTTYTVHLLARNDANDLFSGEARMRLPIYMEWLGAVSPEGVVSYNPNTREIRWNIGAIARGAGYGKAPPEAYFQVALTPSVSQLNQAPNIIDTLSFSAIDRFTSIVLQTEYDALSTHLTQDPLYGRESGTVRE